MLFYLLHLFSLHFLEIHEATSVSCFSTLKVSWSSFIFSRDHYKIAGKGQKIMYINPDNVVDYIISYYHFYYKILLNLKFGIVLSYLVKKIFFMNILRKIIIANNNSYVYIHISACNFIFNHLKNKPELASINDFLCSRHCAF